MNLPKGPKQSLFLEYLNSELGKRIKQAHSHVDANADGSFTSVVDSTFNENHGDLALRWLFQTSTDGTLTELEVLSTSVTYSADGAWETTSRDIIDLALRDAFIENRTRRYQRQVLYYVGPKLDGEYWFGKTRVAPADPNDEYPAAFNLERTITLDFEVDAIDDRDAMYLASETSRRLAARFSLLLDADLYETPTEHAWVMSGLDTESIRRQRGVLTIPRLDRLPKKGETCQAGAVGASIANYGRMIGTLKMPSEARRILRGVDGLPEPVTAAFDGAARMYQIALFLAARFPTAALAYRVAAIDALQQIEPDCNGFSEFMRKYSAIGASNPQLLAYLHGDVRSSHFHAGKFDLGEFSIQRHMDIVHTPDRAAQAHQRYIGFEATRQAIANWMLSVAAAN
ncbi:hypothetical protein [Burkholderia lata]|uniref:hypothetical protein n=1 Tax=Burkholderia lata (strain ATCC 17760 / DSM 23089 / LMG 22485 / NCIMB 9086 / R18194 / 383) TaxID=482957 RepID=UPI0015815DD2|nr:hypothetical protein [Burkholderia lata]